ncbi:MAG: CHC2 zinc finger domain-containing protein [Anaplasmataceae bacterium]|nr:CHC2 zinc finger domain-containing protein [Anaplasmataceae bacterium]
MDNQNIETIKNSLDIVEVISNFIYIANKKGNYIKTLCPFHNEKSSSFTIYPSTQSFYCYGCGLSGDLIKFIMLYNKFNFNEALEFIIKKYNIPVEIKKKIMKKATLHPRVIN